MDISREERALRELEAKKLIKENLYLKQINYFIYWVCIWAIAGGLIITLIVYNAKAEDCYEWPPKYYSTELYPTVEERRYRPRQKLRRQLRRVERKENANLVYFVWPKATTVKATHATLGYDRSWGIGPKDSEEVALKIAQGWEADDFGSWAEPFLEEEHKRFIYETHCDQRNWCRERYVKDKPKLTQCFIDTKLWPSERKLYKGVGTTESFREVVEVEIR